MLRLAQDPETGDLSLPVRLVGETSETLAESVCAALQNLFNTQAQDIIQGPADGELEQVVGEWPFDRSHGMRWRGAILRRYFNRDEIRGTIANTANIVPEIVRVSPGQVSLDFERGLDERRVYITLRDVALMDGTSIPSIELGLGL